MRVCLYVSVFYISLQRLDGHFYVIMFVVICSLSLFADVRWSFWCEYVINCQLFISLCRCVVVLLCEYVCKYMLFISLCRCDVVLLCEYVCKYMLFISLCRCEMVLISLCRCVVILLCEYVCKYMLFISLADVLWSFYVSMFVSICCLFLFAEVRWSFYVSVLLGLCLFLLADGRRSLLCEYVCMCLFFISLCRG